MCSAENKETSQLKYSEKIQGVRLMQVSIDDAIWGVFLYQSGPIDHSTLKIDCNSILKKSDEWKKLYTNKTE